MAAGERAALCAVDNGLLDALPDVTAVLDHAGTITAVNRAWRMMSLGNGGRLADTGIGVNYLHVCSRSAESGSSDATAVASGLRAVLQREVAYTEFEYPCPTPTAELWFLLRITPLGTPRGGAVVSHLNITRRRAAEQELAHRAAHDPLTALANRALFRSRLASALRPAATGTSTDPGRVGVLYADLDGLKAVNDTYGHDAGDLVLQAAAFRLRAAVRPSDTVARLGGDEFAVIAPRIAPGDLADLAARADAALAQPHNIHGRVLRVPASIGTHLAAPGEDVDEVVRRADRAMYTVKQGRTARRATPSAR